MTNAEAAEALNILYKDLRISGYRSVLNRGPSQSVTNAYTALDKAISLLKPKTRYSVYGAAIPGCKGATVLRYECPDGEWVRAADIGLEKRR